MPAMELSLRDVAEIVGGEVHGDPDAVVRGICGLEETGPAAADHICFVAAKSDPAKAEQSAVRTMLAKAVPPGPARNVVVVADPQLAFALVGNRFHPRPRATETRVHETAVLGSGVELADPVVVGARAVIEEGAKVGPGSIIGPGVVIGAGATIGADCTLHANCVLYHGVRLGDRVVVHACAVIGADGFGNAREGTRWVRIPQIGTVVLEDDVEVGACSTIDRATLAATTVGRGTKIDNLVMVGHNSRIGEDSALAGQVGLAGTTELGSRVQVGGQAGFAGHIRVADDSVVAAKAGVIGTLDKPGFYIGIPARTQREFIEMTRVQMQTPKLLARLEALEAEVARLQEDRAGQG